jgi:hypothetical protein
MARLSIKILALGAAIGMGSVLGAGTVSAAPLGNTILTTKVAASNVVEVQHRRGHWREERRRTCTEGQAASKARRMGLRNPRVQVGRLIVRVTGWRHGKRTAIVFKKARGCPLPR